MSKQNKPLTLENMPEYLTTRHLVLLGIYPSTDATYHARAKGDGPEYIKMRHKILYTKSAVIEFLESRMNSNSTNHCKQEK